MRNATAVLFTALFILLGCAGPVERSSELPAPVLPNLALFTPTEPPPSPEEILSLTPEQAQNFLDWYYTSRQANQPGHHRLRSYMLDRLNDFEYVSETLSPAQALARNEGNCMTLAALTYSLSELAGLNHAFQLVNTPPVFDRERNVIIGSDHVRSRVYDPTHHLTGGNRIFQQSHVVLDYFTDRPGLSGEMVSDDRFLAMYYRNLAIEAYIAGDLDRAFTLTRAALERAPDQPDALNLMALLHRRAGDPETALVLYEYISEVHGLRPDVLNNHANLLRAQGREAEAEELEWRLAELDDANPFHWIALGEEARERGQLELALQWFEEAIERAPYLDEAYWRAAVIHYERGRYGRSSEYLRTAIELAERRETADRYRGKLQALNGTP